MPGSLRLQEPWPDQDGETEIMTGLHDSSAGAHPPSALSEAPPQKCVTLRGLVANDEGALEMRLDDLLAVKGLHEVIVVAIWRRVVGCMGDD